MTQQDPLRDLLSEWQSAKPSQDFDERVLVAYRKVKGSFWTRIWQTRVSMPVPVLVLAAMLLLALVLWFRPAGPAPAPAAVSSGAPFDTAGFQPLPHGEARVITVKELYK
jgi:hypothetical protein